MWGLLVCGASVTALIGGGILLKKKNVRKGKSFFLGVLTFSLLAMAVGIILSLSSGTGIAAESAAPTGDAVAKAGALGWGYIAAALATGISCVAAGVAVGSVGSAAIGLIGEKPEMLGTTLIYLGLAEGIAIYGIIISLLILQRL